MSASDAADAAVRSKNSEPGTLARVVQGALGGALAVLPLALARPGFASTLPEWLQLVAAPAALLSLIVLLAALIGRIGGPVGRLGASLVTLALLGVLALASWIVGGAAGLGLAVVAFALLVLVTRRLSEAPGRRLVLRSVAVLAVSLLVTVLVLWTQRAGQPVRQVVMIGLDGAGWDIVDEMRSAGELEAFDRLVRTGARGEMDVIHPVISPPIWTTIATGMMPEAHGISDFWASAHQVRVKRVWDVVDNYGLRSGVFGYLVTWPPTKTTGFLVPGWLAQGPETFPEELSFFKQIEIGEKSGQNRSLSEMARLGMAALRHGVTLGTLNEALATVLAGRSNDQDARERALQVRVVKMRLATDVFCELLRARQPEMAIFYDSSVDAIQHLFFKYFRPEFFPEVTPAEAEAFGDAIPAIYREADRAIARIVDAASPNANFVVVSDHGQEPAKNSGDTWYVVNSSAVLKELSIDPKVRATNVGASVFLRSSDGEALMDATLELIGQVTTTEDQQPLFEIRRRGPLEAYLGIRPGLDLEVSPTVRTAERELPTLRFVSASDRVSGAHTEVALLLMQGPEVQEGVTLERKHVLDVAPTLLRFLGLPISRELAGEAISEAMRAEFVARYPIDYIDTYGAPSLDESASDETLNEETLEKLRALGYIQ